MRSDGPAVLRARTERGRTSPGFAQSQLSSDLFPAFSPSNALTSQFREMGLEKTPIELGYHIVVAQARLRLAYEPADHENSFAALRRKNISGGRTEQSLLHVLGTIPQEHTRPLADGAALARQVAHRALIFAQTEHGLSGGVRRLNRHGFNFNAG